MLSVFEEFVNSAYLGVVSFTVLVHTLLVCDVSCVLCCFVHVFMLRTAAAVHDHDDSYTIILVLLQHRVVLLLALVLPLGVTTH